MMTNLIIDLLVRSILQAYDQMEEYQTKTKAYMRNGVKGILPKGPGIGPNGALPRGGWSRNGSRTLPLKSGTTAGVGKSGSMRHDE